MLGHKLYQVLSNRFDVYGTVRGSFELIDSYGIFDRKRILEGIDVNDFETVVTAVDATKPDVVINAAGIVKQRLSSKDVIQTLSVNSIFPHLLAQLSESLKFRVIQIGTDCVFSGNKGKYVEGDTVDAFDLYGQSKRFGELTEGNVLTLRTSIIGRELGTSHSLVDWFVSNKRSTVNGYVNAVYSGFPTTVFADIISNLISEHKDLRGLFHVSSDPINKFELLSLINECLELDIKIDRFEDFHIDRSLDSTKFRTATGFEPDSWRKMIDQMCSDPTPYDKWKK